MKITFLGAAHQVTGSRTLVEWMEGRYFLVDCGMEQGENELEMRETPIPASRIEYVFLTHAHIDHSGNLPLLYKEGFRGAIYATPETRNLCSIMLEDSAQIQENDAANQTKKNLRIGLPPVEPEYTLEDAQAVMSLFRPCEYGRTVTVDENLTVRFTDAGHLLGSSFIEFFLEEKGEKRKLVCSGDVGNTNQPIIRDPQPVAEADYLMIESTYGTRLHEKKKEPIPFLVETLRRTFDRGGTVIIPSFAVGRTQELLYFFREIKQQGLMESHADFPVYVDSPLANEATAIFLQCGTECLDESAREVMRAGENPIWFEGLNTLTTAEESKALNEDRTPKVIIASGGMCEGGRIRHHLKHNLWDEKNTILFAGYQAAGTLGRIIFDGAKAVKIMGETIEVKAEVALLDGISGHADRAGLLQWLSRFEKMPRMVFVNHGDEDSCTGFAEAVKEKLGLEAWAPCSGSEYDLLAGEWIRLTEPVYRKKEGEKAAAVSRNREKGEQLYRNLMEAVQELQEAAAGMKDHSNGEIRRMTEEIRKLISDY